MAYAFVVVGGGTAGSVLAARLSEDEGADVLLIEAGPARGPAAMSVPAAWPTLTGSVVDWGFRTVPQPGLGGRSIPYPRGHVLGGSSAINALINLRGHRSALDAWESAGAPGWSFDDLLPYYRRSERTEGLDPVYRGVDGAMAPAPAASTHPAARAAYEAFRERGFPVSGDLNGRDTEGVGWVEMTAVDGVRQSSADAYLRPVLGRPNLTVLTDAVVVGLALSGRRCTGVRYVREGAERTAEATAEVVLCAGAVGSPHLLMLSGVGPADDLRAHGIDVAVDLPAVGSGLTDHPLGTAVYASPGDVPPGVNNHVEVLGALRSAPGLPAPDIHVFFMEAPAAPGRRAGYRMGFAALAPRSRGSVRLCSADPAQPPAIDPGLLSDERDMALMLTALRTAREIGHAPALAPWRAEELLPGEGVCDDERLRSYLEQNAGTYFHAVGTCRIGDPESAVTDTRLRVHGVQRLRVADASVMPSIPAANTNATVLAVAERAAGLITGDL